MLQVDSIQRIYFSLIKFFHDSFASKQNNIEFLNDIKKKRKYFFYDPEKLMKNEIKILMFIIYFQVRPASNLHPQKQVIYFLRLTIEKVSENEEPVKD